MRKIQPWPLLAGAAILLTSCWGGFNSRSSGGSSAKTDGSAASSSSQTAASSERSSGSVGLIAKKINAPLYLGNLSPTPGYDIGFYHLFEREDVPYIDVKESAAKLSALDLGLHYSRGETYAKTLTEVNGKTLTIKNYSGETVSFDAEANRVVYSDFLGYYANPKTLAKGQLLAEDELIYAQPGSQGSAESRGYVINLNGYATLGIVYDQGSFYIPFALARSIFLEDLPLAFNGKALYYVNESMMMEKNVNGDPVLTNYGQSFYGTSAYNAAGWTASYGRYNYDALCFDMDKNFGNGDDIEVKKTQASFDSYFGDIGLRSRLSSRSPATFTTAVSELVNAKFGDGHSAYTNFSGLSFGESFNLTRQNVRQRYLNDSERYMGLRVAASQLSGLRDWSAHGSELLHIQDGTAFITFDSFKESDAVNAYNDKLNYGKLRSEHTGEDTMYDFLYCFQEIGKDASVKNVVFDLSLNGGGAVGALVNVFGLLEDEVIVTFRDNASGALVHDAYAVDANLDRKFTKGESYAGKYRFYCLTSNYSFSCGNLFPTMFKRDGIGKVIGERSGGGSCVVYNTVTASGCYFQVSGFYILQKDAAGSGSNDDGIAPDIALARADFYNRGAVVNKLA